MRMPLLADGRVLYFGNWEKWHGGIRPFLGYELKE